MSRNVSTGMKKIHLALSVIIASSLSGCGFGMSADNLLQPPMLSEEQEEIYRALEDAVGTDISLVYPRSGAYRSAFVFSDMDGDGDEEAAVFYVSSIDSESVARVNILDRSSGTWRSVYDHSGAGRSIEQVFFCTLGESGRSYMAIGYNYMTPTEKTMRVYSFSDGILQTEYAESYYRAIVHDLDRNGTDDIVLINCNNENHSAYVSLVNEQNSKLECVDTADLNSSTTDLPSIVSGHIGENTPALFIDGMTSAGTLSTEIIYCINGELRNPAALDGSELYTLTSRAADLYSCDIDGDGVIEIPSREEYPGYKGRSSVQYQTVWNVFSNYTVTKEASSLTVPSLGYCFMHPGRWEGQVTVKPDAVTGERVFYKYNSGLSESRLELMRIAVCPLSEESGYLNKGYFTAVSSDIACYMIKLGDTEDNLLLTEAEVKNNFYLY